MLTRRRFGVSALAAAAGDVAALGEGSALSACSSSDAAAYDAAVAATWKDTSIRPTSVNAAQRELVRYATLAPSNHNVQPWRFRIEPGRIAILADYSRRTPIVDADDHHLFVSLGCAAENLVLAARAFGMKGEPSYDTDHDAAISIATTMAPARVSPLFDAIPKRWSTRADYDGRTLPAADLRHLEEAGSDDGVNLLLLTDRKTIEDIVALVTAANSAEMADHALMAELKQWIRFDASEALQKRDGLYTRCVGAPSLPRWLGSPLFDFFMSAQTENQKYARQLRSSGGVAIFVAEKSDPVHWLSVGRLCQRFALQATALGLRVAFMNQPVEMPAIRAKLAAYLEIGDRRPDIVMRFGYGPETTRSLRRPIEQIIV